MSAFDDFAFGPWIEWSGGECPLKEWQTTQVRYRSHGTTEMQASNLRWQHTGAWDDVLAYRRRLPVMPGLCP